ncbi:hypothetical protein QUF58_13605 [Anaerolineales bacterium HSG24]|nr:hypothetical protein [Anaerolineales bacterium HSG24]
MEFSPYIWELYKNSPEGQAAISEYENLNPAEVEEKFGLNKLNFKLNDEIVAALKKNNIAIPNTDYFEFNLVEVFSFFADDADFADIEEFTADYQQMVQEDIYVGTWDREGTFIPMVPFSNENNWSDWLDYIENVTFGLYCTRPEFYIPYRFYGRFNILQRICDTFDMPIPDIPIKRDKTARHQYYADLNYAFYEFRQRHNLSPAEMCAFLYDFSVKATEPEQSKQLPEPLKAWLLIAHPLGFDMLDQVPADTRKLWSGNVNSRPGDICVMYCKGPRSYIHSIWRAETEGFNDPFSYYHNSVNICSPILTKHVSFREMKAHPELSQTGLIRSKLQGASGKALSVEFYETILQMMEEKGQDISILPRLKQRNLPDGVSLTNERDVEENLLEPLLKHRSFPSSKTGHTILARSLLSL